ncbi:putative leader peptide [Streptomyces coeruleoprunus]|uniref:Leader peptide n=1 Tax=Streptomyces coeruleoprunus TaxID=285563 RepID=A0ABV9XIR8_9ACTN
MPYELLLFGRVHVDLARSASALCPGARAATDH